MALKHWPVFFPGLLAILYGAWLVLTAPVGGLADLAGVVVIGVGVLACVLAAAFLILDRYALRWRAVWWRDLLVGALTLLLALGAFALLARL